MAEGKVIRKSVPQMIEEYEVLVSRLRHLNKRLHKKIPGTFRLMTYNVHGWADARYSDNKSDIQELISLLAPDYVGLQEVISREDELTGDIDHVALAPTNINRGTISGNMCWSRSTINNVDLVLSKHKHGDRCFLFTQIEVDQVPLIVGVIHCDYKSREDRFRDIQKISEYIEQYPNRPMILMGDFNAIQAEDYSYKRRQELLQDDRRFSDFESIAYFHRLTDNTFTEVFEGKLCEFSVWSNRRVDYIFHRNLPWNKIRADIYYTDLSDHLPIIMDIQL